MSSSRRSWASAGRNGNRPSARPCARFGCVEARVAQRGGPVLAEVDGNSPHLGRRRGIQLGQRRDLERQDFRLVNLKDNGARRPGEAVSARVESRRENHDLAYAGVARVGQESVEVPRARGEQVGHLLHAPPRAGNVDVGGRELAAGPAREEVDAHGPYQGLGEAIVYEVGFGRAGPARGDHRGGRADARRQVPSVVVCPFSTHLAHLTLSLVNEQGDQRTPGPLQHSAGLTSFPLLSRAALQAGDGPRPPGPRRGRSACPARIPDRLAGPYARSRGGSP